MTTTKTALTVAGLVAFLMALPACNPATSSGPAAMVAYAADGSLVLFGDSGIDVYDGQLQTKLRHIDIRSLARPPGIGELTFAISADGTVAAAAYSPNPTISSAAWGMNDRLGLYRISDGRVLNVLAIPDAGAAPYFHSLMKLAISPGGTLAYAATVGDGTIKGRVVDTATGTLLWTGDGAWSEPAWSPDGQTLFGLFEDPNTEAYTSLDAMDATSGTLKWRNDLYDVSTGSGTALGALALVGNGTVLTGPATPQPCASATACSPTYPIWSSADGTQAGELPAVPQSSFFGFNTNLETSLVCNATDTCAVRLSLSNGFFVHVYKTDGTTLQDIPAQDDNGEGSMAISPDGTLIAVAPTAGVAGDVNVFNVADGTRVSP